MKRLKQLSIDNFLKFHIKVSKILIQGACRSPHNGLVKTKIDKILVLLLETCQVGTVVV